MAISRLQQMVADKRAEEAAKAVLQRNGASSENKLVLSDSPVKRTFLHRVAGANTILPDGRTLTFYGPRGGTGEYTTSDGDEIEWLEGLAKVHTSQVVEVIDAEVVTRRVMDPDRDLLEAVRDAAANSERAEDPGVNKAIAALPQVIAASTAADAGKN